MQIGTLNMMAEAKKANIGTLTINVTGMKQFRFRAWLSVKLARLSAWVCPMQMDVIEETK